MSEKLREAINKRSRELVEKEERELEDWTEQQIAILNELKKGALKKCLNCGQNFHSSDPDQLLCSDCEVEDYAI